MAMRVELPVVTTPTRVELGQRCYRRHVLADVVQVGLWYSAAAKFGNVLHAGAAAWWNGGDASAVYAAAAAEYAKWFTPELIPNPKEHTSELAARLLGYYIEHAKFAGPMEALGPYEVVMVEERKRIEVGKYILSFQIDRVGRNPQGRYLFVDLKSASRLDKKWRGQWDVSIQFKLYRYAMMRLLETDQIDIVIEGLLKEMGKPAMDYVLAPEWDLGTLEEAVREFERIAGSDEGLIKAATLPDGSIDFDKFLDLALTETAFNYQDCYSYGHECPFRRLCLAPVEDRRAMLDSDYTHIEQEY